MIVGSVFLYPSVFDTANNSNSKYSIISVLCLFSLLNSGFYSKINYYRKLTWLFLTKAWLGWGTLTYVLLLLAYFLYKESSYNLFEVFSLNPVESTNIYVYLSIVPFVLIIPLSVKFIESSDSLKILFYLIVFYSIIIVIEGALNYFLDLRFFADSYSKFYSNMGEKRFNSFSIVDANGFARLISFPFLLILSKITLDKKFNLLLWLIVLFLAIAIILSFSRTTYISVGFGALVLLLVFKNSKMWVILIIFLILSIVLLFDLPSYFQFSNRLSSFGNLFSRQVAQMYSLTLIINNPLFGAFPGQYFTNFSNFGFTTEILDIGSSHNGFLNIGVHFGLPMIMILLSLLLLNIIYAFKLNSKLKKNSQKMSEYYLVFVRFSLAFAFASLVHSMNENLAMELNFMSLGILIAIDKIINNQIYSQNQ